MSELTVAARFRASALRVPERPFLVGATGGPLERLSYRTVHRRACAFAEHLRGLGVKPGDRVVLNCANSTDLVCAYFGTWFAGCTAVPLDPRTLPSHVAHIYRDCSASCLVTPAGHRDLAAEIQQTRLQDVAWDASADDTGLEAPSSHALIIYTSGTTGTPKGVCLSQGNLEYTRAAITDWARVTDADRELTTLSLTHLFGLAHLHVYCALGATVYIGDGVRDAPRLLEIIATEGITSFPGTPAGLKILIDRFPEALQQRAGGLRYIVVNTAPMPVAYTGRLLSLLPDTRIYMYYGLTEASRSTYISFREHPDKLATVGRPSPGSEVCIGNPAHSLVNEPGEILVRGPHVTSGYWGMGSTEVFERGWFRTGDLGTMDEEGFVTWLGRVREQINVDGLKVSPVEVEEVLRRDPRVLDCAVIGAPDALAGECVVAFVVTAPGSDQPSELDLRRLCTTSLENYKIPRRIRFIESIPKTDSGKVKRFLLREVETTASAERGNVTSGRKTPSSTDESVTE